MNGDKTVTLQHFLSWGIKSGWEEAQVCWERKRTSPDSKSSSRAFNGAMWGLEVGAGVGTNPT